MSCWHEPHFLVYFEMVALAGMVVPAGPHLSDAGSQAKKPLKVKWSTWSTPLTPCLWCPSCPCPCPTWCNAVNPSTLAVSISAPFPTNRSTSSLSAAAHAAKKTHPSVNCTLDFLALPVLVVLLSEDSLDVSDSCQRLSCSARLNRADVDRVSNDVILCEGNHGSHMATGGSWDTWKTPRNRDTFFL